MLEETAKKITNIKLDKRNDFTDLHLIDFSIGELNYFLKFEMEKGKWIPERVIHRFGEGACPFCKRKSFVREICTGIKPSTKEMDELFQLLINHPSVRMKVLLLDAN